MRRTMPRFLIIVVLGLIAAAPVATLRAAEVDVSEQELVKTLRTEDASWKEIDQACRDLPQTLAAPTKHQPKQPNTERVPTRNSVWGSPSTLE